MEVNYLAEIIAFERWLETNYLPISSQLLWYKMMNLFNRSGWSEWVIVDNLRLMATMSMGREATLIKARDELIKAGRILYQKGRKGSPNRYKMVYFTCKSVVESEVFPVVENEVKSVVESAVQSADIYKHKQKQNLEKKDTNVSKEKMDFAPPSVEEVAAYCRERGNGIDARTFVEFYAARGWMMGKNQMSDWKSGIRYWESRRKGDGESMSGGNTRHRSSAPNRFHNFEQGETDYDTLMMEKLRSKMNREVNENGAGTSGGGTGTVSGSG